LAQGDLTTSVIDAPVVDEFGNLIANSGKPPHAPVPDITHCQNLDKRNLMALDWTPHYQNCSHWGSHWNTCHQPVVEQWPQGIHLRGGTPIRMSVHS
jgi:hypothetical protein